MFPITNDAVIIGILLFILAVIFQTQNSEKKFWKSFYKYIPALLLCYFIPGIVNSIGIISVENSNLYHVSSRYLLPTSLVLFTIGVDFK